MPNNVFDYIKQEENAWRTDRVPLTGSKDWNMFEHIERCTNVANGWFHQGNNDGLRPYKDIVTPIINVAFRTEGFNVKDIIPYVDSVDDTNKSFLIKKYHPKWARTNEIDTLIDDVVENSVIYDLAVVRKIDKKLSVLDLKTLAFCDQTDFMAGPVCIKHNYTVSEITAMKGKWNEDAVNMAIYMSKNSKDVTMANDQEVETPGKYIEVYELRGELPESWLKEDGDPYKYVPQMHIVSYYTDKNKKKNGIELFKGKDKPLSDSFKALKIDRVRSKGRACGKSIVETLIEPQVWTNYTQIKIKELLDSAFNLILTDSEELGNQHLTDLDPNTIIKQGKGDSTQRFVSDISNISTMTNEQVKQENSARMLGSASEAQLGVNPTSGTPFALQQAIIQQGEGIHEYRQGKIATFFSDVLYRDWILQILVDDMNNGVSFAEELTFDELEEFINLSVSNAVNKKIISKIVNDGALLEDGEVESLKQLYADDIRNKSRNRKVLIKIIKDELKNIPIDVMVNIKGKQRYMAQNADKITNIIREVIRNPQAFTQVPGIGKAFNQLLEESGMNPIDFAPMLSAVKQQPVEKSTVQDITTSVGGEQLQDQQEQQ